MLLALAISCQSAGYIPKSPPLRMVWPTPGPNRPIDFLTRTRYKYLVIEVISVTGRMPDLDAVSYMCGGINKYCHKDSVSVIIREPIKQTIHDFNSYRDNLVYTTDVLYLSGLWHDTRLRYFEARNFRLKSDNETLVLHIAYVDGMYYSQNRIVVGMAYNSQYIVIFKDVLSAETEKSVLVHEVGHVLGLVNNGSNMVDNHEDRVHENHCRPECAMYWAAKNDQYPDFDELCQADLRANGGR